MTSSPRPSELNSRIALSGRRWRTSLAALGCVAAMFGFAGNALADARFDLTGPKVDLRVTRAGMTLPISAVPNLQPGDRLWLHPDLPPSQSIRYLMVLVFLRGTTNPPPDNWFYRIPTWEKKIRAEGTEIVVPEEAQEAVLFLAPVTGGDFSTLRSAVQGRPGIFVRASQDLDLAGFEQARIEKYIASMREVPQAEISDPKALQAHSNVIAGTLALKPNGDCVNAPRDQQYTCLTQSGSQTLLDDGHGQSIVSAISSGPGSDFINAASATSLAGGGVYSAYVGAIVDLVRIMGSLHTAQYQYIPAIAFPDGAALNLRLNTAPSFHNPKSVIVIGLPSIQATAAPPLRPTDPKHVSCLAKPALTLPVEGAPLVFSTGFAHDLVLHINYPEGLPPSAGEPQDIPLKADAYKGGLVLGSAPDRKPLPIEKVTLPRAPEAPGHPADSAVATEVSASPHPGELTGTIEGFWGFDTFKGPTMPLQNTPGKDWKLVTQGPLIAGQDAHVQLTSTGTACLQSLTLDAGPGQVEPETWKPDPDGPPNTVKVALKLSAAPGGDPRTLQLSIRQFGSATPDAVKLVSYAEPAKLTGLSYHAGDTSALLAGSSLEEVRQVQLGDASFQPAAATGAAAQSPGDLPLLLAGGGAAPHLYAGDKVTASVTLKDGRVLPLNAVIEAARPSVALISKAIVPEANHASQGLAIALGSPNDLPLRDALLFALKSTLPFARQGRLEVASADGSFHTILTVEGATLILQDPHTVLGKLEPLKSFGPSAFGPVQVRAVNPDGSAGEWIPLATLVRLPVLTAVTCAAPSQAAAAPPASAEAAPAPQAPAAGDAAPAAPLPTPCTLAGSDLYLLESVSTDPSFVHAVPMPEGFVGASLAVPAPVGGQLYIRLRDDPAANDIVSLPSSSAPSAAP